jgi:catechol 2,3-dioxygenase-like lactoylglutathione lyase family enzyme
VLTLFVPEVEAARAFYQTIFGLPIVYEDAQSAVMPIGGIMINLLQRDQAPALVAPMAPAPAGAGPQCLLTIKVADVDRVCADLLTHGATLLNGPVDRPWGRRTAAIGDPAGHVWEVAQEL